MATLAADPASILNLYRRLIALRREHTALSTGRYIAIHTDSDVLAFERCDNNARLLVALNFGNGMRRFELPPDVGHARMLLSTCLDRKGDRVGADLSLRPAEGVVLQLLSD